MDRNRDSISLSTDRLSNLPCTIIGHILALLPLKEAARTIVLSKKWKDKWLTIPSLVFEEEDTSESVISHVLQLHNEPIVTFAVKEVCIESPTVLYRWLNFLSKHRIEDLTIIPNYEHLDGGCHVLPYHLFSFYYLKHLSLHNFDIRVPSMYDGFSNLLSLDLDAVYIEPDVLQRFILKCPMLESLRIGNYREIATLKITAPTNLKSFEFSGTVDSLYIYSNAHLEYVKIDYYEEWSDTEIRIDTALDYAIQFFSQLSLINKLEVDFTFLRVLARSVPSKLTQSLNGLKHIHFDQINLSRGDNLIPALCLIRSSPNLQTLVLALDSSVWYLRDTHVQYEEAIQCLEEEQISTIPLCISLKEVTLHFFNGLEPQMEFLKLLLFWAKELRKVEIKMTRYKPKSSILKKFASLPRASSQAVFLIS